MTVDVSAETSVLRYVHPLLLRGRAPGGVGDTQFILDDALNAEFVGMYRKQVVGPELVDSQRLIQRQVARNSPWGPVAAHGPQVHTLVAEDPDLAGPIVEDCYASVRQPVRAADEVRVRRRSAACIRVRSGISRTEARSARWPASPRTTPRWHSRLPGVS